MLKRAHQFSDLSSGPIIQQFLRSQAVVAFGQPTNKYNLINIIINIKHLTVLPVKLRVPCDTVSGAEETDTAVEVAILDILPLTGHVVDLVPAPAHVSCHVTRVTCILKIRHINLYL